MPYHPMKKYTEKIDDWGAAQAKKFSAQRDAGASGGSFSDRLNAARGKDNRWETPRSKDLSSGDATIEENVVPNKSARVGHLPPAPPSAIGAASRAAVPPPPQRASGVPPLPPSRTSTAAVPQPASSAPSLPRRMDNENGTAHPPPPYPAAAPKPPLPTRTPSQSMENTNSSSAFAFSSFDETDKQDFFALLDEYFAARLGNSPQGSTTRPLKSHSVAPTTNSVVSPIVAPVVQASHARRDPPKPSGPTPKPSVNVRPQQAVPIITSSKTSSSWSYPRLGASSRSVNEPCKALAAATFFVYRDSFPEWSGGNPWFLDINAMAPSLKGRRDMSWSATRMSVGNDHTAMSAAFFDDLSCLWWRIRWNGSRPTANLKVDVAFREPPAAWDDDERLQQANRDFGEWIAGFAEKSEQSKTPVGDGECWTLAAEAIKYTNASAQLVPENRLMTTIGRTHGHLIYAGKTDASKGQCGRWRGGDRNRNRWGGIRRGDIIEWCSAQCSEVGGAPGSYVTIGAPEHTAIIVDNSPAPERLANVDTSRTSDHYTVLGVKRSATQAEIRAAYLTGARKSHPDRVAGTDDERIQRLNEAYAVLSDARSREQYDDELQQGRSGPNAHRIGATIDLDAMEVVEGESPDQLLFHYSCRCGNGFYIGEDRLRHEAKPIVGCSGCSEKIKIIAAKEVDDHKAFQTTDEDDHGDQPQLSPWEFGSVTTIEQSAGQVPTRRVYDLSPKSFTKGEFWIYRPVWEAELLGAPGGVQPTWPPNLPDWQALT